MTQQEYLEYHAATCKKALELSSRKNNDYADPELKKENPLAVFSNFLQCESLGICSTESGFLVRLSDKFSRICNLLKEDHTQAVMDESVEDTILDVINYMCLLSAYRVAKANIKSGAEPTVKQMIEEARVEHKIGTGG